MEKKVATMGQNPLFVGETVTLIPNWRENNISSGTRPSPVHQETRIKTNDA